MAIFGIAAGSSEGLGDDEEENEMSFEYIVNPPSSTSNPDGSAINPIMGKQGEQLVSEVHGKYYTQNYRGNLYYGSNAAAGAAFSIFSNTTFVGLALWNPQGSGKNLSIAKVYLGLDTQASTAMGAFGYSWLVNAGAGLATAAPVSAFTAITATRGSCICGAPGVGNSVALLGSGATLTTAMTWGRPASFSTSTGAITTVIGQSGMVDDVDGTIIVPPGVFFTLTTSILTGITGVGCFVWEELPL